jgi:hypothetical protein
MKSNYGPSKQKRLCKTKSRGEACRCKACFSQSSIPMTKFYVSEKKISKKISYRFLFKIKKPSRKKIKYD